MATPIRQSANHELYKLQVVHEGKKSLLKATLTENAIRRGVRFDPSRGDDTFDLTEIVNKKGHDWTCLQGLQQTPRLRIDMQPSGERVLRDSCMKAESQDDIQDGSERKGSRKHKRLNYDLDKHLSLVDYVHPYTKEIYYKLDKTKNQPSRRTLVLCFDGTSNQFSSLNTNVVKLVDLLEKDHPERQLVYYQPGVGTYEAPGWSGCITKPIAAKADEGLAFFLHQHVIDGYKYLVETYEAGDRVCIFGFSRGAFTARALAGMIHCVGLLSRHNIEHIQFAYNIYASHSKGAKKAGDAMSTGTQDGDEHLGALGWKNDKFKKPNHWFRTDTMAKNVNPEAYKRTFCIPLAIDFVGVWDTVGSVGSILSKTLPFIDYNPSIRVFRHAVALDERRANFAPSLWDHTKTRTKEDLEHNLPKQDVREVWFRGEHSDIGGGAPPSKEDLPKAKRSEKPKLSDEAPYTHLSNIPLRWMVQQCLTSDTGLIFDNLTTETYRRLKVLEPRPLPIASGKTADDAYFNSLWGGSSELDAIDIRNKVYNSKGSGLGAMGWGILEAWPSGRVVQTKHGAYLSHWPNLGRNRRVCQRTELARTDKDNVFIHSSVVDYLGDGYVPRTKWHGYEKNVYPRIDATSKAHEGWDDAAKDAMKMDWKPKLNWMNWKLRQRRSDDASDHSSLSSRKSE